MEDENKHVNTKAASEVDPSQDQVYVKTTSVVKSIVELNTGVQMTRPEEFVDLVKVCSAYPILNCIVFSPLTFLFFCMNNVIGARA